MGRAVGARITRAVGPLTPTRCDVPMYLPFLWLYHSYGFTIGFYDVRLQRADDTVPARDIAYLNA